MSSIYSVKDQKGNQSLLYFEEILSKQQLLEIRYNVVKFNGREYTLIKKNHLFDYYSLFKKYSVKFEISKFNIKKSLLSAYFLKSLINEDSEEIKFMTSKIMNNHFI